MTPLAFESASGFVSSAIAPNFAGPNSALCVPISPTTTINSQGFPVKIAPMPSAMMTISATLQATMTFLLLNRSARNPAGTAKIRYGNVKLAMPTVSARLSSIAV